MTYWHHDNSPNVILTTRPIPNGSSLKDYAILIPCPFCPLVGGCVHRIDEYEVKEWLGIHLAKHHPTETDKVLERIQGPEYYDEIAEDGCGVKVFAD